MLRLFEMAAMHFKAIASPFRTFCLGLPQHKITGEVLIDIIRNICQLQMNCGNVIFESSSKEKHESLLGQ